MDAKKMREEFEASMQGMTFSVDLSRGNHGCYRSLRTHELYCSWVSSWQASREAVVVELPELRSVPDRDCWSRTNGLGFNNALKESRQMIEAQGLKVEVKP